MGTFFCNFEFCYIYFKIQHYLAHPCFLVSCSLLSVFLMQKEKKDVKKEEKDAKKSDEEDKGTWGECLRKSLQGGYLEFSP